MVRLGKEKRYENEISLICCLLILLAMSLACDGTSQINGKVFDSEGKVIPNAKVVLQSASSNQDEEFTAANGTFHVLLIHAPFEVNLTFKVTKRGYRNFEREITSTEAQKLLDSNDQLIITLEKE